MLSKTSQRTFVLEPKGPRHTQRFKEQVVAAYQERTSIRRIHYPLIVCHTRRDIFLTIIPRKTIIPACDTRKAVHRKLVFSNHNLTSLSPKGTLVIRTKPVSGSDVTFRLLARVSSPASQAGK